MRAGMFLKLTVHLPSRTKPCLSSRMLTLLVSVLTIKLNKPPMASTWTCNTQGVNVRWQARGHAIHGKFCGRSPREVK